MLICQSCLGRLFKRPKNSSLIAVCQNCGKAEVPCIEMNAFKTAHLHARKEVPDTVPDVPERSRGLPKSQEKRAKGGYLFLSFPHPK